MIDKYIECVKDCDDEIVAVKFGKDELRIGQEVTFRHMFIFTINGDKFE